MLNRSVYIQRCLLSALYIFLFISFATAQGETQEIAPGTPELPYMEPGCQYRIETSYPGQVPGTGCFGGRYSAQVLAPVGPVQRADETISPCFPPPCLNIDYFVVDATGTRKYLTSNIRYCSNCCGSQGPFTFTITDVEPITGGCAAACGSGDPCADDEEDVRFRFGVGSFACAALDGALGLANYITLSDGSTFELSFWSPDDNNLGTYCGEGPPQVWVPNNDDRPNAPRFRPYRPQPRPPANPEDPFPPSLPQPTPSALPPCTNSEGVFDPPAFWNANEPFDFNDYISSSGYVLDYAFVEDRSTSTFQFVEDNDEYYFNAAGRDEWGLIRLKVELVELATGAKCSLEEEMEVLDYGLYFFSDATTHRKITPNDPITGFSNNFFDPSKPTVLYAHGLNEASVAQHNRERILAYDGSESLLMRWKNEGYNVGMYYWNQFSDRTPTNQLAQGDVERIINDESGSKPWRKEDGSVSADQSSPQNSLKLEYRILINQVKNALQSGVELRLAGHSMGGQLTAVTVNSMTSNFPDRVALLDPFFTAGGQNNFVSAVVGINNKGIAQEYYSSSFLNKIPTAINTFLNSLGAITTVQDCVDYGGGQCSAAYDVLEAEAELWLEQELLVENTVYVNLTPRYEGATFNPFRPGTIPDVLTNKHFGAVDFYFRSINEPTPSPVTIAPPNQLADGSVDLEIDNKGGFNFTDVDGISAASCNDLVRQSIGKRFDQIDGGETPTISDDIFQDHGSVVEIYDQDLSTPIQSYDANIGQYVGNQGTRDDALALGNPSEASDTDQGNFLDIVANGSYKVSYNCMDRIANWSAWHLSSAWRLPEDQGGKKTSQFRPNTFSSASAAATAGCYEVAHDDYKCGKLFSRGHLCPAADRNLTGPEILATFNMSNMVPQNQSHNDGLWLGLEDYLRRAVDSAPIEMYIFAGGRGIGGFPERGVSNNEIDYIGPDIRVPKFLWKAVLIIPEGENDLDRINSGNIPVDFIGFISDNSYQGVQEDWINHLYSLDAFQDYLNLPGNMVAGDPPLSFFDNIDESVRSTFDNRVYDYTNPLVFDFITATGNIGDGESQIFNGENINGENLTVASGGSVDISGSGEVNLSNTNFENGSNADITACDRIVIGTSSVVSTTTTLRISNPCNLALTTNSSDPFLEYLSTPSAVLENAPSQIANREISLVVSPNPFTSSFRLQFEHTVSQAVKILVYNQLGQEIETVASPDWYQAGKHELQLDTQRWPSGIYFVRLESGEHSLTKKIVKQ